MAFLASALIWAIVRPRGTDSKWWTGLAAGVSAGVVAASGERGDGATEGFS